MTMTFGQPGRDDGAVWDGGVENGGEIAAGDGRWGEGQGVVGG